MNEALARNLSETAAGLDPYWMPFSHNRYFKRHPAHRLLARAEGAYYWTVEGERLFDCLSGLWCVGLGHAHPRIGAAQARQLEAGGNSPAVQMG